MEELEEDYAGWSHEFLQAFNQSVSYYDTVPLDMTRLMQQTRAFLNTPPTLEQTAAEDDAKPSDNLFIEQLTLENRPIDIIHSADTFGLDLDRAMHLNGSWKSTDCVEILLPPTSQQSLTFYQPPRLEQPIQQSQSIKLDPIDLVPPVFSELPEVCFQLMERGSALSAVQVPTEKEFPPLQFLHPPLLDHQILDDKLHLEISEFNIKLEKGCSFDILQSENDLVVFNFEIPLPKLKDRLLVDQSVPWSLKDTEMINVRHEGFKAFETGIDTILLPAGPSNDNIVVPSQFCFDQAETICTPINETKPFTARKCITATGCLIINYATLESYGLLAELRQAGFQLIERDFGPADLQLIQPDPESIIVLTNSSGILKIVLNDIKALSMAFRRVLIAVIVQEDESLMTRGFVQIAHDLVLKFRGVSFHPVSSGQDLAELICNVRSSTLLLEETLSAVSHKFQFY